MPAPSSARSLRSRGLVRAVVRRTLAIASFIAALSFVPRPSIGDENATDAFPPPLSAEAGLASISVPDGLKVELVAAEPIVLDPVAFDWGRDGELWVAEMADYPSGEGGRVVRLNDRDGDGRCDDRVVFIDKLPLVNGVMTWRDGVLVSAAPDIFYAEDTNGDGRCDARRTLFRGFTKANPQHVMNGFVWGLDGWVHAGGEESQVELAIGEAEDKVSLRGDFRFDPDDLRIEPENGRTQFGRARNDFGDWFGSSNSDPGFQVVLERRYLDRNPHLLAPSPQISISETPGAARVYPTSPTLERFNDLNKANRFTSACGFSIYRDDLLGERFRGNSFVAEPVHNLVHREVLSQTNGRWSSRRADEEATSEFFRSPDPWCRPVATKTGPDGALWIADMYRLVIEHPEWIPDEREARVDVHAGADRGRIYRVVPEERDLRPVLRTKNATAEELVAVLESPNGAARDRSHLELFWRNAKEAAPAVVRIAKESPLPAARVQALSLLANLEALDDATLLDALRDDDEEVRRFAVRLAEPRLKVSPDLASAVTKLADDASVRVRMQTAPSLGELPAGEGGAALARIVVRDGGDPYLRAAAFSSATNDLAGFCEEFAARIDDLPSDLVTDVLSLAAASEDDRSTNLLLSATLDSEDDDPSRASRIESLLALDEAFRRRSISLGIFLFRNQSVSRLALAKVQDLVAAARKTLEDEQAPGATRATSLRFLVAVGFPEDRMRIDRYVAKDVAPALQAAALDALFDVDAKGATKGAIERWNELAPPSRSLAIDRLTSRAEGRRALLEAIAGGTLPANEIDAAKRQALLGDEDESVRELAANALGGPSDPERGQVVERYRSAVSLASDAMRGQSLFEKHCANCHRIGERGHAVGPDLAALSDRSPDALLTAILDPNRAVETKFVGYLALGTDGRTHQGLLVSESDAAIELLAAEGKRTRLLRSEIEMLKSSGVSMMPTGLEKDLDPQAVADVIAYVREVRPERKTFAGNQPRTVDPEGLRGEFWLLPRDAELYGPTLTFREATSDLVDWRSDADAAAWTIAVVRPGTYRLSVEYARSSTTGGATATVEIDGERRTLDLTNTGNDENFVERHVADVELAEGERRVVLRASSPTGGESIWRPQAVRLRPLQ